MPNPVLIELTRGPLVESVHCGALAVTTPDGAIVSSVGDVATPVFPRSAIKPLQAVPLLASGAADRFGFGAPEIALACASHSGTPRHAAIAMGMLTRAGLTPAALACGVHEPMDQSAARDLILAGGAPSALDHNCSGKHAGMLATAVHQGEPTAGYWRPDHPVQVRIARVLEDLTGARLGAEVRGIDGCSVPNWAIPLAGLARAFARLGTGDRVPPQVARTGARAVARIVEACWTHPDLVAGPGRLNTLVMQRLPGKVLMKSGAEGVYCGAFPERGLGFALKIDDGAKRGAEAVVMHLITRLYPAAHIFSPPQRLTNWRGLEVGQLRGTDALEAALDKLG